MSSTPHLEEPVACGLYRQPTFRRAVGDEFRPGGLEITETLVEACRLTEDDAVLDLGCGVGSTASFLARSHGLQVTGLDACAESIDEARARGEGVEWVLGQASRLPFPAETFAAVFSECFLSLLSDRQKVLEEVRRVLRPGGYFAMSDLYLRNPQAPPCPSGGFSGSCLGGARPRAEIEAYLGDAGFVVQTWRDHTPALKALMVSLIFTYGSAARFWEASVGKEEVPTVSAWVAAARPGYFALVARAT